MGWEKVCDLIKCIFVFLKWGKLGENLRGFTYGRQKDPKAYKRFGQKFDLIFSPYNKVRNQCHWLLCIIFYVCVSGQNV